VWGLPFQVRADDGGENTAVGGLMIHYQGADQDSFLTGPSVHNNCTERLWREVVHCILFIFRNIFLHLEQVDKLNCTNEVDLLSLRYVNSPRINDALELSTEHNMSPHQLWISGILRHHSSNYAGVGE